MRTQLHQIVADVGAPSRRGARADVQGHDADLRRAVGRRRVVARRASPARASSASDRVARLPRQADRDRRRRSSAPRPPAASSSRSTRCCGPARSPTSSTTAARASSSRRPTGSRPLRDELAACTSLEHVVVVGGGAGAGAAAPSCIVLGRRSAGAGPTRRARTAIDVDMAAILYTSGSTGQPKGVVLSHRNLIVGAASVSQYLGNTADDVILAALPLSFDAGFSQLTTALHRRRPRRARQLPAAGRRRPAVRQAPGHRASPACRRCGSSSPSRSGRTRRPRSLRYFANTGGRMPQGDPRPAARDLPAAPSRSSCTG